MDTVRQWAFSACAAMVACALARMLLPKSGLERMFSVTVSVFFLCCLLSPAVLRMPSLQLDIREYGQEEILQKGAELQQMARSQADTLAEGKLEKIIDEKLTEMGIKHQGIAIHITRKGQNPAELKSVEIMLEKKHQSRHSTILSALREALGMTPQLVYR